MKHPFILLLVIIFASESIAQTIYESAHVKDGKTMRITIPEGFYFVDGTSFDGNAMYATQEGLHYDQISEEGKESGLIAILHEPHEGQTIESFAQELKVEFSEMGEKATILQDPKVLKLDGRKCVVAGITGEMDGENVRGIYFGGVMFGDYLIVLGYYARESVHDVLSFDEFEQMMRSWEEISTSKEDEMLSEDEMEDYSIYFQNDLFETEISYHDVLPDVGIDWLDAIDYSGHLLSMFSYKNDNGFLKVFSGGSTSNYPSDEEKARAIEKAMDWGQTMTLTYKSQFSNEDHFFKLYSISGGGTMSSVYTTIVNRELVFFVVDGGAKPAEEFKPAVRDFMLTMWVDYYEKESTDEK